MTESSCPELVDIVPKLDDLDDPFWQHARGCGRCVQAVTSMDPTIMAREVNGKALRPSVIDRDVYGELRPLARGGMYQTWETVDSRLGRTVVIKGLPDPELEAARGEAHVVEATDAAKRLLLDACLRREALILAELQHPSIVTLLEAGQWRGGETFYAMEYVKGVTLRDAIGKRSSLEKRLDLLPALTSVVRAIAYAHDRGVVHRDLSPNNIIVGDGTATVIDWTTAKRVNRSIRDALLDAAELPETGPTLAALGTPGYAPAEQATPSHDHRVDIFALGATLQFLVTGTNPFEGGTDVERVLANVAKGQRIEPKDCPPALAAIIRKATQLRPEDRYATAEDLADDLQRFQSDQFVLAHRYTRFERFVHSRVFKPFLVILLVLFVGGTGAFVAYRFWEEGRIAVDEAERRAITNVAVKERERDDALRERGASDKARDEARLGEARAMEEAQSKTELAIHALNEASMSDQSAASSRARMTVAIQRMKEALDAQKNAEEQRDLALDSERQARAAEEKARVAETGATQARLDAERRERAAITSREQLKSELDKTLREVAELKTANETANSRVTSLATQVDSLSADRNTALKQSDDAKAERDQARRDRDDLQRKLEAVIAESEKLRTERDEARKAKPDGSASPPSKTE